LNFKILSNKANFIEEISYNLFYDGKDFSKNLVVFPGKRPKLFLNKILFEKQNNAFIPPVCFSVADFIDFLYEEKLSRNDKKIDELDALALLYEIHQKSPDKIGKDGYLPPDMFFSPGMKIFRDIEDFYINLVPFSLVKQGEGLITEKIPANTALKIGSLSRYYKEFDEKLARLNLSTGGTRFKYVIDNFHKIDLCEFKQMFFCGIFVLNKAEEMLLKKVSDFDNVTFFFQDGKKIEKVLSKLGINLKSNKHGIESNEPELNFYSSPDTHGQVFALAGILKNFLSGKQIAERNAIVVPQAETLFPLLQHILLHYNDDAYNISRGYPVHRSPVYGFFISLIELSLSVNEGKVYLPDYLKFVMHPYTKNVKFNGKSETTRIVFHSIEEYFLEKKKQPFLSLSEIENDEALYKYYSDRTLNTVEYLTENDFFNLIKYIHENTINKVIDFENIGHFALKTIDVLSFIYNHSTANLHPLFHPFAQQLINSLTNVSESLIRKMQFTEKRSYFNFIKEYLITQNVPFEGTPLKGFQTLGFLETRCITFENVYFLDANDEVIPGSSTEDSLLPFKAREMLGMPTYKDKEDLSEYYFSTLISGAKRVFLFYIEDDKMQKSRFLEKLIWKKEKEDGEINSPDLIKKIRYKVSLKTIDTGEIRKNETLITFLKAKNYSASELNTYLKCGLHFYYKSVLKLNEKEELTDDIESSTVGNLVHETLECIYNQFKIKNCVLSKKLLDSIDVEKITKQVFNKNYGENVNGSIYLLQKQIIKRISDYININQKKIIDKSKVLILDTEKWIQPIMIKGYNFQGKIDRIEKRDDRIVIIDYKTASNDSNYSVNLAKLDFNKRATWAKAVKSIQLPFYTLLYSKSTSTPVDNIRPIFLFLGKAMLTSEDIEIPLFKNEEEYCSGYFAILEELIFKLLDEITNINEPFKVANDSQSACKYCSFSYLCCVNR